MHPLELTISVICLFCLSAPVVSIKPSCRRYVLSGCSDKYEYCTCDTPAVSLRPIALDATETLSLGEPSYGECQPSCLLADSTPLPHRPNLTTLSFENIWVAPDDRPFPVTSFLVNVRATLHHLALSEVYLPTITRDTFVGFVQLDWLALSANRLSAIDVNAFSTLGAAPGSALPKLNFLGIDSNNLTTLDWTVFKPLTTSLKVIALMNNSIQRIFFSRYYVMHGIWSVNLASNQLTGLGNRFLRSITPSLHPHALDLEKNPICSSDRQCREIRKLYRPQFGCCSERSFSDRLDFGSCCLFAFTGE